MAETKTPFDAINEMLEVVARITEPWRFASQLADVGRSVRDLTANIEKFSRVPEGIAAQFEKFSRVPEGIAAQFAMVSRLADAFTSAEKFAKWPTPLPELKVGIEEFTADKRDGEAGNGVALKVNLNITYNLTASSPEELREIADALERLRKK